MQSDSMVEQLQSRVANAAAQRRELSEEEVARLERNMTLLSPQEQVQLRLERARLQRYDGVPCGCMRVWLSDMV